MLIFSQFGEIAWQRLFNIVRILQTIALKGLICISLSRWITFVSQLYPGRISDKEFVKSNFCQTIEMGDQYLADKNFEIHDLIFLQRDFLPITSSQKASVLRP